MSSNTAIRVISMATAQDRRSHFSGDAQGAGVPWAFFDALRLPQEPLRYDEAAARVHTGRPLRPGEIGCYASHYSLWRWFLESEHDQLVVFEDDVVVDWAAIRVLYARDLASDGIHILKLFATHLPRSRIARYKLFSDHSHLVLLQGYCYGTQAYVLTKQGAAALVESCGRLTMPVDWAMSRYWDYRVSNYAVFPFPVLERLGPSIIGHSAATDLAPTPADRVGRFLWRVRDRLTRAWVDLRQVRRPFGAPTDAVGALFGVAETQKS